MSDTNPIHQPLAAEARPGWAWVMQTPTVDEATWLRGQALQWRLLEPAGSAQAYGEAEVQRWLHAMQPVDDCAPADLLLPRAAGASSVCASVLAAMEAARRLQHVRCMQLQQPTAAAESVAPQAPQAVLTSHPWQLQPAPHTWPAIQRPPTAGQALVSVIVRSMDRPTLGQALDSIAAQTHPNIEVLLVQACGAAHAMPAAHCGGFALRPLLAPDGGPLQRARAANFGLDAAQGELLLFLDDDDLLQPDHLSRLVAALQAHPQAIAAFADVEMGADSPAGWQPLHRFEAGFDPTRLLFENYLPIHAVLFRRGPQRLDEAFDLFEDWDFWLQLSTASRFVHVPGVSALYRVHGKAQSNVFSDSAASRAARAALFEKWRQAMPASRHLALLEAAQALYRKADEASAELRLARDGAAAQAAVLQARELELQDAMQEQAAQHELLQARERELADSRVEIESLRALLAQREASAADAARHAGNLQAQLQARQQELLSLQAHAQALQQMLQARQREADDAMQHAGQLEQVLSARDTEIANLHQGLDDQVRHNTTLQEVLQSREAELAQLHAETPLRALKRTIRKRPHARTPR